MTSFSSSSMSSFFSSTAHLIVPVGDFDHAAADLLERSLERRDHGTQRQAGLGQQRREYLQLNLPLEPADRRDFGDSGKRLERRLYAPFVDCAQLAQVSRVLAVDQRVLVDPAHAARVGAEPDVGVGGEPKPHLVDSIQRRLLHRRAATGVVEDQIDERIAEVRRRSNGFDALRSQQRLGSADRRPARRAARGCAATSRRSRPEDRKCPGSRPAAPCARNRRSAATSAATAQRTSDAKPNDGPNDGGEHPSRSRESSSGGIPRR